MRISLGTLGGGDEISYFKPVIDEKGFEVFVEEGWVDERQEDKKEDHQEGGRKESSFRWTSHI